MENRRTTGENYRTIAVTSRSGRAYCWAIPVNHSTLSASAPPPFQWPQLEQSGALLRWGSSNHTWGPPGHRVNSGPALLWIGSAQKYGRSLIVALLTFRAIMSVVFKNKISTAYVVLWSGNWVQRAPKVGNVESLLNMYAGDLPGVCLFNPTVALTRSLRRLLGYPIIGTFQNWCITYNVNNRNLSLFTLCPCSVRNLCKAKVSISQSSCLGAYQDVICT